MEDFKGVGQKATIWMIFRKKYKLTLTEEQLELINEIYYKARKESAKDVVLYRLVNLFYSLIMIIIWFYLRGSTIEKYFFPCVLILFALLNLIYGFIGKLNHRSIKRVDFSNE